MRISRAFRMRPHSCRSRISFACAQFSRKGAIFFAYLTHKPHEVHERYRDTNVFWVKGRIIEPIVN